MSGCGFNKSGRVNPALLEPTAWTYADDTLCESPGTQLFHSANCLTARPWHKTRRFAEYLTTSPYAELTQWVHPFKRWLDREAPDDTYRYEATPTIAVAETIRAKNGFIEHFMPHPRLICRG